MAAARQIDLVRAGITRVRLKVIVAPADTPPANAVPANVDDSVPGPVILPDDDKE